MNTKSEYTDLQLQQAIVKELSELINPSFLVQKTDIDNSYYYCHAMVFWDTKQEITSREWDWIVRELENKLSDFNNGRTYAMLLAESVGCPFPHATPSGLLLTMHTSWQQRAIVYFKTIGKEIV